MGKLYRWLMVSLGALLTLEAGKAQALPGQLTGEVEAWIQGHPTLQPSTGETLLVRKSDTAAQRFIFEASVFPPGRINRVETSSIIRSERISLFDVINGVTRARLEESLRVIYGVDIAQDYERGRPVYLYPEPQQVSQSRNQVAPLLVAMQGELRVGQRFAYWLEIVKRQDGVAYTGQMMVFLKEDLPKIAAELRGRS